MIAAAENVLVAVRDPVDLLAYNNVACGYGDEMVDAGVCSRNDIPDKPDASINWEPVLDLPSQNSHAMLPQCDGTVFADGLDDDSKCAAASRAKRSA